MAARASSSCSRGIGASLTSKTSSSPSLLFLRPASSRSAFPRSNITAPLRLSSRIFAKSSGEKVEPAFRVSGELISSAPPHLVWEVLTDYDGAASIFNNVSESRVLGPLSEHRKGDGEKGSETSSTSSAPSPSPSPPQSPSPPSSALSSFLTTPFEPSAIEQHCSWKFLLFGGSFRMMLGVEEGRSQSSSSDPSDSDSAAALERSLVFSLLEPGFVRAFEGVWSVAVVEEDGRGGWRSSRGGGGGGSGGIDSDDAEAPPSGSRRRKTKTVVKHSLGVTPAVPPPVPVRPVVRKLFQRQVAGLLDDLERELERRMTRTS